MTKDLTYLTPKSKEETEEMLLKLSANELYDEWLWCSSLSQRKSYYHIMKKMRELKKYGSKKLLKLMDNYYHPKK